MLILFLRLYCLILERRNRTRFARPASYHELVTVSIEQDISVKLGNGPFSLITLSAFFFNVCASQAPRQTFIGRLVCCSGLVFATPLEKEASPCE